MKCPCENCVCLPVCRHKEYSNLFIDCSLIREYIPDHNLVFMRSWDHIYHLEEIMKPTRWGFEDKKEWNIPFLRDKER